MEINLENNQIEIKIASQNWFNRKAFYISAEHRDFFPKDALGARGKPEQERFPSRGEPVIFDYVGVTKSICDIATTNAGLMRPRLTGKPIDDFFKRSGAEVGDSIMISRGQDRVFHTKLVKKIPG
jgi:hypothetical protein